MPAEHLAVIGDPIGHSLSPRIQNAAIAAAGLDAQYEAVRVLPSALPEFVHGVRKGAFRGFNVTIPHKQAVAPMLDTLHAGAREIGAVNAVVREGDLLAGYNTDVLGFLTALQSARDGSVHRALVLGAGGSARAVVFGLVREGVTVSVSSRRDAAVVELTRQIDGARAVTWAEREAELHQYDLVVNATPLGMIQAAGESPITHWPQVSGARVAFDLVYGRQTPFLHDAALAGWTTVPGLEMLVQQAAASFRLWFDVDPDVEVMRAACRPQEIACSAS